MLGRFLRITRWVVRAIWLTPALALVWRGRPYHVDLVAQFAPQAGLAVLLFALFLFLFKNGRRLAIEGAFVGLVTIGLSYLATRPWTGDVLENPSDRHSLVVFNAQQRRDIGEGSFEQWLRAQNPDLVCIVEPPMGMGSGEDWFFERYPHRIGPRRGMTWALLLLSKFPMEAAPLAEYSSESQFSFVARRSVRVSFPDGAGLLFTAMHPPSPRSLELWHESIAEVKNDGDFLREGRSRYGLPMLVAGDFNSSPTGRVLQELRRSSGMRTGARPLNRGTWPSWAPAAMSLPLDNVLMSPDVQLHSVRIGPAFRSDHRPVVIEFSIEKPTKSDGNEATAQGPPEDQ